MRMMALGAGLLLWIGVIGAVVRTHQRRLEARKNLQSLAQFMNAYSYEGGPR